MTVYNMIFSPTGGTQRVAHIVSSMWNDSVVEIDLCDERKHKAALSSIKLSKDDLCIIAVPSYGGRVPKVAVERLSLWKGNGCDTIFITTYGNRDYEDTLLELQDTMVSCGFHPIAAIAAITQHSIMPQFGKGRPDECDVKTLTEFVYKIQHRKHDIGILQVPGNRPYRTYNGVPLKPKATSLCINCGMCAASCPVQAIPIDHPNQTDRSRCISCMRCIRICPKGARSTNKFLLAVASLSMKSKCKNRKEYELFLEN